MPDRILVDEERLQFNTRQFLRGPHAAKVYEELDVTPGMCLFLTCFTGVLGLLMLPTIIWTMDGARCLWSTFTLESFTALKQNASKNPDKLRMLILHLIVIGPDQKHALAVGTFRPADTYSADWITQAAIKLGQIHKQGAASPAEEPLATLLRDDTYHPNRRRPLPQPYDAGLDLMLFDVEVDLGQARPTPYETVLLAFVVEPEEKGGIVQAPWGVVADAVWVQ